MYEMEDSRGRNLEANGFNTKLFRVNEKPLKFYLEGFNKLEFYNAVKIIEAYGGKFSTPTGDTIIFSNVDYPIGIRQCYDLKYFQDSIIANQCLDLEKYRLPLAANRRDWDVRNYDDAVNKKEKLEKNDSTLNDSFVSTAQVKQERSDQGDDQALIIPAQPRSSVSSCKRKVKHENPVKEEPERRKLRKRNTNINYNESVIHVEDSINSIGMSNKGKEGSLDWHRSLRNAVKREKSSPKQYTVEENRQIIQYLIDKNAICYSGGHRIWKEMEADLKTMNRSAECLRTHFRKQLRPNYKQYTEDLNAHKEFEKLNVNVRRNPWRVYSQEENRQIIQYLIDNNSIARAGSLKVWEKMAADNIINRSANSLITHFCRKLKYEYEQYTEDAGAREEFEILRRKKPKAEPTPRSSYQRRECWSREENQIIMNYLIANDLIGRVTSRTVWSKVIEKAGLVNKHTTLSLQSHFKEHLRDKYWEYTTDPEALRKFAAGAKKRN